MINMAIVRAIEQKKIINHHLSILDIPDARYLLVCVFTVTQMITCVKNSYIFYTHGVIFRVQLFGNRS